MPISRELLDILVCPICKGALRLSPAEDRLNCLNCPRSYPIRDNIPVMLSEEAEVQLNMLPDINSDTFPRSAAATRSDDATPFSATYFPWSVIADEAVLKRALLYFQKVLLIGPSNDDFYSKSGEYANDSYSRCQGVNRAVIDFYDKIRPLLNSGLIEIVDANRLTSDATTVAHLKQATVADVLDPVWNHLFNDLSFGSIELGSGDWYGEASPEGDVAYQYWRAAGLREVCASVEEEVQGYLASLPNAARTFLVQNIRLPESVIGSLLINSSLACIQQNRSVPLCDTDRGMSMLHSKYHRIFDPERNPHARENERAMDNLVADVHTKAGILATYTLELLVPNIEARTLEETLEIRERFKGSLELFRLKMVTLATKLKRSALDPDFSAECQQFITAEIMPVLLELQKQIRLSTGKVLRELSEGTLSLKPTIPFVISALSPLPVWAAALAAAGILTLESALKLYLEREQATYNNGFAYLLNVQGGSIRVDQRMWSRSGALLRSRGV